MSKRVMYGQELREALMRGVDTIANAVKSTLGPRGRNVIIGQRQLGQTPRITKDGITVARWVDCVDPAEQLGSDLLREASQKTMDTVGDGTTTSMVLAQAMCRLGFEAVRRGAAPFVVRRGMERASEAFIDEIRLRGVGVAVAAGSLQISQVAQLAANGDSDIAALVADAITKIGPEGVITVEEGTSARGSVEIVPGLQIPAGYQSQYFSTDAEAARCELHQLVLLVWEGAITSARALGHVLSQAASAGAPLLVIAGDFEQEALALLVHNRVKNQIQSCAVKIPVFGDRRREIMRDIAALTGGVAFTEDMGVKLESVKLEQLGKAQKATIDSRRTIIVGGENDQAKTEGRVNEIKTAIAKAVPEDKPFLQARLANLTGGIAVIRVGAVTDTQMKERKDRVEDAMYATKAAVESGILPGGGTALLRASRFRQATSLGLSGDEMVGWDIVRRACRIPCEQIATNAGLDGGRIVDQTLAVHQTPDSYSTGYNAATESWEDLIASGVIDPVKVVVECLRNAVAVAGELICTDAAVMDMEEKHDEAGSA